SRLAIGPVVQVGGSSISSSQAQSLQNDLITQARKRRPKAQVLSTKISPSLIKHSGGNAESAISSAIRSQARKNGATHLLITEISANRVSHSVDSDKEVETEPIYDCNGKRIGEEIVDIEYSTTAYTRRDIESKFKVIDLSTGKVVWVTRTKGSRSHSNRNESHFHYPPPPPHPAAPSPSAVIDSLAKSGVRKLPRTL
ncbi:MAG: hypothetical protein AAF226_15980, partial [Verrucomicrobiota bacterium]